MLLSLCSTIPKELLDCMCAAIFSHYYSNGILSVDSRLTTMKELTHSCECIVICRTASIPQWSRPHLSVILEFHCLESLRKFKFLRWVRLSSLATYLSYAWFIDDELLSYFRLRILFLKRIVFASSDIRCETNGPWHQAPINPDCEKSTALPDTLQQSGCLSTKQE